MRRATGSPAKDLDKIRNVTDFAHARPHLFTDYPRLRAEVAHEYLTVDDVPKAEKQRKIIRRLTGLPRNRLFSDIAGAVRAFV